jgi:drug/metabolite transporter (DMT)-like permease
VQCFVCGYSPETTAIAALAAVEFWQLDSLVYRHALGAAIAPALIFTALSLTMVNNITIIVVGGQFFWFNGLKFSSAGEVALASAFSPIAGVLAAYMILAEAPTPAQYLGGFVIICGIGLNQFGLSRLQHPASQKPKAIDAAIGFKGI